MMEEDAEIERIRQNSLDHDFLQSAAIIDSYEKED